MFKLTRWIMQLQNDKTGKREFAFILFITAISLTIWISPSLEGEGRENILVTWIYAALLFGALAFGAEVLVKAYIGQISENKNKQKIEEDERDEY